MRYFISPYSSLKFINEIIRTFLVSLGKRALKAKGHIPFFLSFSFSLPLFMAQFNRSPLLSSFPFFYSFPPFFIIFASLPKGGGELEREKNKKKGLLLLSFRFIFLHFSSCWAVKTRAISCPNGKKRGGGGSTTEAEKGYCTVKSC